MKKAVSAATSAALLASLLATAVAPSAFAAVSSVGVGNVPVGGTSTNAATFTLSEEAVDCVSSAGAGHIYIQIAPKGILPSAVTSTDYVKFTGTPVLTAPGSLGASVSLINQSALAGSTDTIDIKITASDPINKQQITVTGVKIKAGSAAVLGAIDTTITDSLAAPHALASCFLASTTTASGTVSAAIGIGATSVTVAVSSGTFAGPTGSGTGPIGKLVFATGESVNVTSAGAVSAGLQTLVIAATTVVHAANEAVTQSGVPVTTIVFPYAITTAGTVVDTTIQDVGLNAGSLGIPKPAGDTTTAPNNVNPGEQNQPAVSTYVYERTAGFIVKDTTLTFTINQAAAPGVVFSTSPSVRALDATTGTSTAPAAGMTLDSNVCTLSFTRTSCTIKVTAASTAPAAIQLYNITVDVPSTVAKGSAVNVDVTGVAVSVDYNTIAYASRVIVGVAAQPTIYINYNDQPSGMMSLTEAGAGFFTDGSSTTGANVFGLCLTSDETFTRAPWAVVSTGDLKLLSGLVGATSVQGTLFADSYGDSCAKWTVYSASTVASTIDIRGSDSANAVLPAGANNGPRYSVPADSAPGATLVDILVGTNATVLQGDAGPAVSSKVSNAVRAFKSGVVVTALSQPTIPQGTADSLGGKLQITETLAGQFKPLEDICVAILPRASNAIRTQDTLLKTATTNDLPVITTNTATGLLASAVGTPGCQTDFDSFLGFAANLTNSFEFEISQQAFGSLGQITISNIHFITTADAPVGPVLVAVAGWESGVEFQTVVSNAKIGVAPKLSIGAVSALGLKPTSGYTTSTPKTAKLGKYITWKFTGGAALAGQRVNVLVAKKINGAWGGPKYLKSAWADANGIVTFTWTSKTAATLNVRVQWPGGANYAVSTSKALGGSWK